MHKAFKNWFETQCHKRDLDPELFDLTALWDNDLSYKENKKNILKTLDFAVHDSDSLEEYHRIIDNAPYLRKERAIHDFVDEQVDALLNNTDSGSFARKITPLAVRFMKVRRNSLKKGTTKRTAMSKVIKDVTKRSNWNEEGYFLFVKW